MIYFKLLAFALVITLSYATSVPIRSESKAYASWWLGNKDDFKLPDESVLNGGFLLAGGGLENDASFKWFLKKALGGDVLVFSPSSPEEAVVKYDKYNIYFYDRLFVDINSVETIIVNSRENVGNNPEVAEKVRKAEAIFFGGGDQQWYFNHLNGTLVNDALDYFVNVKKGVIGGTSAGCAIMSQFAFIPTSGSITSSFAMKNPYDKDIVIRRDLIKGKILKDVIADTHYYERGRQGRHITFMGRILKDGMSQVIRGIGVDQQTSVCIEANGRAYVYGLAALFLKPTVDTNRPETLVSNDSVTWSNNRRAISGYEIKGNNDGDYFLDLNDWSTGKGGRWDFYYIEKGVLKSTPA